MELALKIFQFVLSISILVFLHELGHYIPAKWFKTRAEKFFLFFDPWFSLFSMKKINGKWQYKFFSKNLPDTEIVEVEGKNKEVPLKIENLPEDDWRRYPENTKWGIGWLPMGGYVKIAGMVDESMDLEQLKKPAQPWEFRSKPAWQRLIIMLGGVTVNFFLAWFIYSALSFYNGEEFRDLRKFQDGLSFTETGKKMGFQNGDKIIAVDGKSAERFETTSLNILFSKNVTVERAGKEITFPVNEDGIAEVVAQKEAKLYMMPRFRTIVKKVPDTSAAKKAGLQSGDVITKINGMNTAYFDQFSDALSKNKNKQVEIGVLRNNTLVNLNAFVNKEGKLGFEFDRSELDLIEKNVKTTQQYSFLQSIPRGLERTIDVLTTQIKQFRIIFNSKIQGYKSVGGPIAIVNMMNVDKDDSGNLSINWPFFWSFTAMFSVWLAFLNLIPIPGLDGGHVMFTLWEIITGKPVPQKVLENAQMIGVIFLLGLMVLIFGNDIFKVIMNKF